MQNSLPMMEWDDDAWIPALSNSNNENFSIDDGQLPKISLPGKGFDDIELQYQAYDHGIICEDFPNGLPYDASVEDWKAQITEGLFTKLLSDATKRSISQVRHRVRAKAMLKLKKEKKMEDGGGRRAHKGPGRGSSSGRKESGRSKAGSTGTGAQATSRSSKHRGSSISSSNSSSSSSISSSTNSNQK